MGCLNSKPAATAETNPGADQTDQASAIGGDIDQEKKTLHSPTRKCPPNKYVPSPFPNNDAENAPMSPAQVQLLIAEGMQLNSLTL